MIIPFYQNSQNKLKLPRNERSVSDNSFSGNSRYPYESSFVQLRVKSESK